MADNKEPSFWVWFLFGFGLAPFALIAIVFLFGIGVAMVEFLRSVI